MKQRSETIHTDAAPQAIGPYSQAIRCGNLLFVSGQIAIDPTTSKAMSGGSDITQQCERIFKNLTAILSAAGLTPNHVVKTTVFLSSMEHFKLMNQVYGGFFGDNRPARSTVAVVGLPAGVDVEIDAIAAYD